MKLRRNPTVSTDGIPFPWVYYTLGFLGGMAFALLMGGGQ